MARRENRQRSERRQRTSFSSQQTAVLESEYAAREYISRQRRSELAKLLQLTETQIKIWFQNRRAKDKRIEKAYSDQHLRWNIWGSENLLIGLFQIFHNELHCINCKLHELLRSWSSEESVRSKWIKAILLKDWICCKSYSSLFSNSVKYLLIEIHESFLNLCFSLVEWNPLNSCVLRFLDLTILLFCYFPPFF